MRALLIASLLVLASACKGRSDASAPVPNAAVAWNDAGGATLTVGAKAMPVPAGDLALGQTPPIDHDEAGTRFSYVTTGDKVRVVYVVGGALWPAKVGSTHASKAPPLDDALGDLFEAAGSRRAELVKDVREAEGEAGVVKLLVRAADVEAPEWDATFATLSPAAADQVRAALAPSLEPGKPTRGLRRAVVLRSEADVAKAAPARAAEEKVQDEAPRAASAMLRALAKTDAPHAAEIGCAVASRVQRQEATKPGAVPTDDPEGRAILLEAAVLAVARAGAACPAVADVLVAPTAMCSPAVRCGASGPLSGRDASKQDEPLCAKEQLAAAVTQELARPLAGVVKGGSGTRPALFALAAVTAAGKDPPEAFARAHARRRYALAQPASPECDAVAAGTACHCDEATIRDQACRNENAGTVRVGLCAFTVDDKSKRIKDVVASPPP